MKIATRIFNVASKDHYVPGAFLPLVLTLACSEPLHPEPLNPKRANLCKIKRRDLLSDETLYSIFWFVALS